MYRYKLSCIGIVASNAHFDFRMRGQTDLPAREAVVGGGLCRSAQGGHVDDEGLESVYNHQSRKDSAAAGAVCGGPRGPPQRASGGSCNIV